LKQKNQNILNIKEIMTKHLAPTFVCYRMSGLFKKSGRVKIKNGANNDYFQEKINIKCYKKKYSICKFSLIRMPDLFGTLMKLNTGGKYCSL